MSFSRRDLLAKLSAAGAGTLLGGLFAAKSNAQHVGYDDTPMLPGGHWRVHDSKRPQPPVVSWGRVPNDAKILFGGPNMDQWSGGPWKLGDDYMEVAPGKGNIQTKESFGDCQLHIEFMSPAIVKGDSQGRGNSGIFMQGRYEIQVLDCFNNKTYADGTTGCLYGQTPPLVNACLPPGQWQRYDIIFVAPRFENGKLLAPGIVTVLLNGIIVQHATPLIGSSAHRTVGTYEPHGNGPIVLQDHGDLVRYRNIWIREIGPYDQIKHRETWEIG